MTYVTGPSGESRQAQAHQGGFSKAEWASGLGSYSDQGVGLSEGCARARDLHGDGLFTRSKEELSAGEEEGQEEEGERGAWKLSVVKHKKMAFSSLLD